MALSSYTVCKTDLWLRWWSWLLDKAPVPGYLAYYCSLSLTPLSVLPKTHMHPEEMNKTRIRKFKWQEWYYRSAILVPNQHVSAYDMNIFITPRMRSHKSFRTWVMITNYGNLTTLGNNPVFPINCSTDNNHFINRHCSKTRITSISIRVIMNSVKKFRRFHSWKF